MKIALAGLAALALAGCASRPPPPPPPVHDARCAMGCAHYHWEEADRYQRLYDPVYVDEYGYGERYEGGYDYGYDSERSYDGYGYGEHRYPPPPPPPPRYDDDRYRPPPPPYEDGPR